MRRLEKIIMGETTSEIGTRLAALRRELRAHHLDGLIVPHADEHQNEFLLPGYESLAWVSGFTGSAGLAIILLETAALFVDGRYELQAQSELDKRVFTLHHSMRTPPTRWLSHALSPGDHIGYDPRLHPLKERDIWQNICTEKKASLVPVKDHPLYGVWADRPLHSGLPVEPHDLIYAGQKSSDKLASIGTHLRSVGAGACVLSGLDSLAWLFNIRGSDTPYTPLARAFGILDARSPDGATTACLFIDSRAAGSRLAAHLSPAAMWRPIETFGEALDDLGRDGVRIHLDPNRESSWLFDRLQAAGAEFYQAQDPCQLPKACKNAVELEGAHTAHRRDGVALCRFLRWLEAEAPHGKIDEKMAADRLEALRSEDPLFRQPSFQTISATGPNGALIHYQWSPSTNRFLKPGDLYLVDSGGQYPEGTTDVTRCVVIGGKTQQAKEEMRYHFTHVLKGHIALAMASFPRGTSGAQLDSLARAPLWKIGLDYDHGTGHGVGSYLGVHEGPQRLAKKAADTPLQPGMILSNEPGYYRPGFYGIRIENLLFVKERKEEPPTRPSVSEDISFPEGQSMLSFAVLTLVPIDHNLIDRHLLTADEEAWINAYHDRVRAELTPLLDPETAQWVAIATRPLAATRQEGHD